MKTESDRAVVGALVAAIRAERKLSPAELARRADVDVKTVRNLESGARWPQDVTRAKLEKVLGLTPGLIRNMLADADARDRARNALMHGDLSTWSQPSDGEANAEQSDSWQSSIVEERARRTDATPPVAVLNLNDAAEFAGSVADFLNRVNRAATDMDCDTRTLLTRAQVRTVAFLYTLVAGSDDVDQAVANAASVAERLGGDELFRDGISTALDAIAQLSRTNRVQLTGRESIDKESVHQRDAIDVATPGGQGHVYLQFVNEDLSEIKLHDTPRERGDG